MAALCAAALFAVATALQHRSAGLVTGAARLGTAELPGFMSKTLRHPLWVIGALADIAGFASHAFALREGPLTLVQPLLVTGVIFALPLRHILEHRRPRPDEIAWAAALVVGLGMFIAIATPANGTAQPPDVVPTIICGIAVGLGLVACFLAGRRSAGGRAALVLGAGAALASAAGAGLLKEIMGSLGRGLGAPLMAWPVYALVVVGIIGLTLNQLAFQAGPLSLSLPAVSTTNAIVSLVIGVAVFDERFRHGTADLLGEAIGLALVVVAAVGLARSAPAANPQPIHIESRMAGGGRGPHSGDARATSDFFAGGK